MNRRHSLNRTRLLASLALLAVAGSVSGAALTDADEIVAQANLASYYPGVDGRAEVRMRIMDAQGREQRRQFTILRRNVAAGGDQNFLVVFSRPSDVRGTVYLVKKHIARDDDRWLYLPGLDLVAPLHVAVHLVMPRAAVPVVGAHEVEDALAGHVERHRVWVEGYGWRHRRVEVCD